MEVPSQAKSSLDPRLPEYLVRTVRHDVGDFLQTVYSAVALLQHRLPVDCTLERTILSNLRVRAGACKELLDTLHDFVCGPTLNFGPVKLTDLTQELVKSVQVRFPHLQIRVEADRPFSITADGPRLGHVGNLMLMNACQAARRQVVFRIVPGATPNEVEWTVTDDGAGLTPEQLEELFPAVSHIAAGDPGGRVGAGTANCDSTRRPNRGVEPARQRFPGAGFLAAPASGREFDMRSPFFRCNARPPSVMFRRKDAFPHMLHEFATRPVHFGKAADPPILLAFHLLGMLPVRSDERPTWKSTLQ